MPSASNAARDQSPAYLFFSWLFFAVLAAHLLVKTPVFLSTQGATELALLTDCPFWLETRVQETICLITSCALVLLCAAAFTGYLLRLCPPPAAGSAGPTYLGAFAAATLTGAVFPFAAWVWGGIWSEGAWKGVFVWIAWLFYLLWNARRRRTLNRPFVLFLRRFNSFADLALLRAVLRSSPRGTPVVLLAGSGDEEAGIWDPATLVALGLRTALPFSTRPLLLEGRDRWREAVEFLIHRAAVIVLDTTEQSASIEHEIEIIQRLDRMDSLLQLSEGPVTEARKPDRTVGRLATIRYARSWGSLVVSTGLVVAACLLLARYADLTGQFAAAAARGELVGSLFGGAIMIGAFAVFLVSLMVRKGLDPDSRAVLGHAIREGLSSSQRQDPRKPAVS